MPHLQILAKGTLTAVKELIAETVIEFYHDLEFIPKSKSELLAYYAKTGYLQDLDNYQTEYAKENGVFFVLVEGDQVWGCGGLRRLNSADGELVRLWLRKDIRKRGWGRQILEKLILLAEEMQYNRLFLDTSHRCVDAVRLFKANGFIPCEPYKESIGEVFLCLSLHR